MSSVPFVCDTLRQLLLVLSRVPLLYALIVFLGRDVWGQWIVYSILIGNPVQSIEFAIKTRSCHYILIVLSRAGTNTTHSRRNEINVCE